MFLRCHNTQTHTYHPNDNRRTKSSTFYLLFTFHFILNVIDDGHHEMLSKAAAHWEESRGVCVCVFANTDSAAKLKRSRPLCDCCLLVLWAKTGNIEHHNVQQVKSCRTHKHTQTQPLLPWKQDPQRTFKGCKPKPPKHSDCLKGNNCFILS